MSKFRRDSNIKILKKEILVSSILETLIFYPAEEVTKFFKEINLSFPRSLRIDVLKRVLRDPVLQTREERATLADEMNYRLSWFNQYTESQLVNLFPFYKDSQLNQLYLEELWLDIIDHITDKKISEEDLNRLINASVEHAKTEGLGLPNLDKYNDELNPLFYDRKYEIDGLPLDIIRPVLYKSSTLTEIRSLGKKYGVNVPRRLKKSELVDIIVEELDKRNELTEGKAEELSKMSVLLIQRFAKNHDIKASTELKKEEIIEYILANAKETKESYFVPSSSVYELEAHEVGEAMPEPLAVEEEVEEVLEVKEIVEEVIKTKDPVEKVETKKQVVYVQKSSEETNEEIDELREELEYLHARNEQLDVKRTLVNTVSYAGVKPKKFGKQLKEYEEETQNDHETVQKQEEIQSVLIAGFAKGPKTKRRNPFWAILRVILIVLILLLMLLLVYGLIRPENGYPGFQKFDDIFNYLKIGDDGMLDWYTKTIRGLF